MTKDQQQKTTILLFGKNGQVGYELNRTLPKLGEVTALGREEADFSNPESLRTIIQQAKPDIIINAVAYTAVDKAEDEEELARLINGVSPGVLAEEAQKLNALLIHYSTDYVFDGAKGSPYLETDEPNPINAYGRTKLAGERAIKSSGCDYLIFRTSWVYASRGSNFLLTMLKLAKVREELSIVSDQIGAPTSARLISDITIDCLNQAREARMGGRFSSDIYHLASSGQTSWHGFAEEIVNMANAKLDNSLVINNITPIFTKEYPTPAKRPKNSQLSTDRLKNTFGTQIPTWKQALESTLEDFLELSL